MDMQNWSGRKKFSGIAVAVILGLPIPACGWAGYLRLTGNIHEIEPGVLFRSAQLDGATLDSLVRKEGIRAVLNLRGAQAGQPWYDDEIAASARDGVRHFDLGLSPTREPDEALVTQLVKILNAAPKPLLIHCNGGADRSGLASALYELRIAGKPIDQAAEQLSFRYGHFPWLPWSRTGAMDRTFRRIAASASSSAGATRATE
jgi:protein tyrosine phosphatase (PTP) superfamily phosphohydrolase (DUF442 family)